MTLGMNLEGMTLELVTKTLTKQSPIKDLLFWHGANAIVCPYLTWKKFYDSLPEGNIKGGEVA